MNWPRIIEGVCRYCGLTDANAYAEGLDAGPLDAEGIEGEGIEGELLDVLLAGASWAGPDRTLCRRCERHGGPPVDIPQSPEEWQSAVDAAEEFLATAWPPRDDESPEALEHLMDWLGYEDLLARGEALGFRPRTPRPQSCPPRSDQPSYPLWLLN